MSNWKPIETAPKDGNHIQLWRPNIQFVGYYCLAGWASTSMAVIDPPPTHWSPLREPPRDTESVARDNEGLSGEQE